MKRLNIKSVFTHHSSKDSKEGSGDQASQNEASEDEASRDQITPDVTIKVEGEEGAGTDFSALPSILNQLQQPLEKNNLVS